MGRGSKTGYFVVNGVQFYCGGDGGFVAYAPNINFKPTFISALNIDFGTVNNNPPNTEDSVSVQLVSGSDRYIRVKNKKLRTVEAGVQSAGLGTVYSGYSGRGGVCHNPVDGLYWAFGGGGSKGESVSSEDLYTGKSGRSEGGAGGDGKYGNWGMSASGDTLESSQKVIPVSSIFGGDGSGMHSQFLGSLSNYTLGCGGGYGKPYPDSGVKYGCGGCILPSGEGNPGPAIVCLYYHYDPLPIE